MKFGFAQVLQLLPLVGPAVAATKEFIDRFEELLVDKSPEQQEELRDAYSDLMADNDEAHERLQAKLAKAALD